MDHQIHVFHRYRTKQDLISHDDCASEPHSILKSHFNRTHIRNHPLSAISKRNLLAVPLFQAKLKPDVLARRNRDSETLAGRGDAEGQFLLRHYLTGRGRPLTITTWKSYMTADNVYTANPKYRKKFENLLRDAADKRSNWRIGQSGPLNWTGHAEMANGEGMIGYQYLHGTNTFTFGGTITRKYDNAGREAWEFNLQYSWKDTINKNNDYWTDLIKNSGAEIITLGGATPYQVNIEWRSKATLPCDTKAKGDGWPFKNQKNP